MGDALSGRVQALGQELGIETPAHTAVYLAMRWVDRAFVERAAKPNWAAAIGAERTSEHWAIFGIKVEWRESVPFRNLSLLEFKSGDVDVQPQRQRDLLSRKPVRHQPFVVGISECRRMD